MIYLDGSNKKTNTGVLETGKSCQIIATLGYSTYNMGLLSAQELSILRKTFQFINLFYRSHDLQMQQDGSAVISVKYTGFLEAVSGASEFDIMQSVKSKKRLEKVKAASVKKKPKMSMSEFMSKKKAKEKPANEAAETTEILEVLKPTVGQLVISFGEIIDTLFKTGKTHVISTAEVRSSQNFLLGKPLKKAEVQKKAEEAKKENKTKSTIPESRSTWTKPNPNLSKFSIKEAKDSGINPFEFLKDSYVCYVTFGDLMDAYCKKVGDDLVKVAKEVQNDTLLSDDVKQSILKRTSSFLAELKKMNICSYLSCSFQKILLSFFNYITLILFLL